MITNIRAVGAKEVAKAFELAAVTAPVRCRAVVHHFAALLETYIKANASGRPGPNAPTGDYRRSWSTEYGVLKGADAATVGTNRPQGRRLEYGFVGVDSLGRHYDQPPFPHVGPAVRRVEGPFEEAIAKIGASV